MITADITSGGVLAACLGFLLVWFLIDRTRTERVVFTSGTTVPGPGMCGCGAPKCTPELAPFPGDVPVLAAPVQDPATGAADDSEWNKHAVRDVWALLDAEAGTK
jgi:hypothetical protein